MNKIIYLGLTLFILNTQQANAQTFEKGDFVFSFGSGIPNTRAASAKGELQDILGSTLIDITKKQKGLFHAKAEYALSNKVGLGIVWNYAAGSANHNSGTTFYNVTDFTSKFNARVNYHPNSVGKLFDPYIGAGLGAGISGLRYKSNLSGGTTSNTTRNTKLGAELTIGLRTYAYKNLAVFGELGIAKSIAQIGLSYRLRGGK